MAALSTSSSSNLSHISNCDCSHCTNKLPTDESTQPENWYKNVAIMPSERKDYFDHANHDGVSDSEHDRRARDEQIRQAPYLPKIQIWARDEGPYTLRVGNQWFHCDDLIITGSEYGQRVKSTHNGTAYSPQKTKRPASSRAQSYQRTRPDNPQNDHSSSSQYQPQTLPTPKEQAAKRRADRKHQEDLEAEKSARRDSGTAMLDDKPSSGSLVAYSYPPQTQTAASTQARASRPTFARRGSSRNGSYSIPVRSKGRKDVRFAPLPR